MGNKVTIVLDAKDLASDKIAKLVSGLNTKLGSVGGKATGIGMAAGGMGAAFDMAFGLAVSGAKMFMTALESADEAVQDAIKASAGLAAGAGIGFSAAEELNKKVTTQMEKSAAALPGVTAEFIQFSNMISDSVAESSKDMNGGVFSAEKYADSLKSITEAAMVLKGKNFSTANAAKAIEKMTAGGSIAALKKYAFYQQNPAILAAYEKVLRGRDTKSMSRGELLKATTEALQRAMPPEALAKMKGTIDAQVQNFMTKLFGTYEGLFSLNRDTDKITAGDQTGQAAIARYAESVFGNGGLMDSVGKVLEKLGLAGDPMKMLVGMTDNATNYVKSLTGMFDGLGGMKNLDISTVYNAISAKSRAFFENINWSQLGFEAGRAIVNLVGQVFKMDFLGNMGSMIGVVFGMLGGLGAAVVGVIYQLGANILNGVVDAVLFVPRAIGNMVMTLIGGIVGAVKGMIWVVQNPKQAIMGTLKWLGSTITNGVMGLLKWIGQKTLSVLTFGLSDTNIGKAMGGAVLGDVANKGKEIGGDIAGGATKATGGWNPFGWMSGLFGGNKASGWMPAGSPIARELAAMPGGAKPVVANSSEAIFNQSQQSAVAGLIRGNRGGGTFAPVITIQGNADQMTVDYLMGELDRRYRQYSAGFA